MTDERDTGFGFRIRPLPPQGATPEPVMAEAKEKKSSGPRPERSAGDDTGDVPLIHTGGQFLSAQGAMKFIGAVAGARLASEARARRGPATRWWVETPVSWEKASSLVASAGGIPYAGADRVWTRVPADGRAPIPLAGVKPGKSPSLLLHNRDKVERLEPEIWPEADLRDLVTATPLRPISPSGIKEVVIVTPGALAAGMIRRALHLGFQVEIFAAAQEPLAGGPTCAAAWLHITWEQSRMPRAFLRSLTHLPFTAVVRSMDTELFEEGRGAALLVDIRYTPPLSAALVATMVPKGEHWLLGGPEVGHWRVRLHGRPTDASNFITIPYPSKVSVPDISGAVPKMELPLRLIRHHPLPGFPDALLLDENELFWLRDYLIGRPLAENAYLLPGPGRYLLLAPGGLPDILPFGVSLRRVGPGGLHLQEGRALLPPLPESARGHAFPCADGEIVAVAEGGKEGELKAFRFRLEHLVPLWSLWLTDAPEISEGITGEASRRISELAKELRLPDIHKFREKYGQAIPQRRYAVNREPDQLRREALALVQAGRLAEAARCMEVCGDMAAAGRLYEQAAGER